MDLFFDVSRWVGEPRIGEPDKCGELVWAAEDELPPDVVDYIAVALGAGKGLVTHGWLDERRR